jgi:hypothetical protein
MFACAYPSYNPDVGAVQSPFLIIFRTSDADL